MRVTTVITLCLIFLFLSGLMCEAESGMEKITFLHTNDSHSALRPHSTVLDYYPKREDPTIGGLARVAALIERERARRQQEGEAVFMVSAGDFFGGDPYAWLSLAGKAPELTLMQDTGYDIFTIGNHEYDYGPELLADYLKQAGYPDKAGDYPILAANTEIPGDHPLAERGLQDNVIQETETGCKIGFFGLLGEDAVNLAQNTGSLKFPSPTGVAEENVTELRDRGADIIVAISHSGLGEDRRLAREVEGIDVIIGGHSHHVLESAEVINDTIIVQAGSRFQYLGILELGYFPGNKGIELLNNQIREIDDSLAENSDISNRIGQFTRQLDRYLSELTGDKYKSLLSEAFTADFSVPATPKMAETPFGNLITDAMRLGVADITGDRVDFAFQANGLIRSGLTPGKTPRGRNKISFYQLAAASGLGIGPDQRPGYPLVEIYLTGEEVRNILEISILLSELRGNIYFLQNSGLRYTYDPRRAVFLNLPLINKPLPTGRAVLSAEKYTGTGIQTTRDQDYRDLTADNTLYRVVTDYYLVQFLPEVGEIVPSLKLELKNKQGKPLEDIEEAIINYRGQELKVWQVLFHYADMQQGSLARGYDSPKGRIKSVEKFSVLARSELFIIIFIILIGVLIYYFLRSSVR